MDASEPAPGLAVIHSNRLENLRALLVEWLRQHPLAPLENEVVLVQSNGMAQWLKLALAEPDGLGIAAALALRLPARFLWEAYAAVLGQGAVPERSVFDREALGWRLYRMLPELRDRPDFAVLRDYLEDDRDARKRWQLAEQLAGLFDQYQVYRADWLEDWAAGEATLRDAHGRATPIPVEQRWQVELWRLLLADLPEDQRLTGRAHLHERFLSALAAAPARPAGLPRRIVVFGISSLPQQTLGALAALGRFCQVLLCVQNPCRHYWADIIEHRELLRAERRRHPHKARMPVELPDEALHLHANPLLAAWGKQGRDYLRLLDACDEPSRYRDRFEAIDLFEDYGEEGSRSLLQQVQQAVLDLEPPPADPALRLPADADGSLWFHVAHGPQREVEILHDRLLALFANVPDLTPREVIVMVPDINAYAPHIRAVFGQVGRDDARFIPFSLADQRERGRGSLLRALESLLRLPESRWAVSDILDLLDAPAVRARFGLVEADLAPLQQWIEEAGIRWGIDAAHRADLELPAGLEQNAWRFGLRRMLLGYAVGAGETFADIEPYDEIGGLDAARVGHLAELLETLERFRSLLVRPAPPAAWAERLRQLLDAFFLLEDDADVLVVQRLLDGLERWQEDCRAARLEEDLPLVVVREAWLAGLEDSGFAARFLAGRVNFCTLLPMRAIPFRVVCLLGMNDGDFPRSGTPLGFDLMALPGGYRPGDRSRRDDDRYLFLEAVLSARDHLHISWVGRRLRDDGERPPSLLVAQLRDYLAAGWRVAAARDSADAGQELLRRLTVEHPLQAFSPRYFLPPGAEGHDPRLFTHAREWRAAHDPEVAGAAGGTGPLAPAAAEATLKLAWLERFLRQPVAAFFADRLEVRALGETRTSADEEPFACDRLAEYRLGEELLRATLAGPRTSAADRFAAARERQRRQGLLPLGRFADLAQAAYADLAWTAFERTAALLDAWPTAAEPVELNFPWSAGDGTETRLEDWLPGLRSDVGGRLALIQPTPREVLDKSGAPRWHRLLPLWVRHLAGCAEGLELSTFLVGADGGWWFAAVPQDEAATRLGGLIDARREGLREPLPVAAKTAFAWLGTAAAAAAEKAARDAYEGGYQFSGERSESQHALARAYPDFDSLWRRQTEFAHWARTLYEPLGKRILPYPGDAA